VATGQVDQPTEKSGRKMFFFEKKNQKTFILKGSMPDFRNNEMPDVNCKSFLLLFFKKEDLSAFQIVGPRVGQVLLQPWH
jgi:hypothetical protein